MDPKVNRAKGARLLVRASGARRHRVRRYTPRTGGAERPAPLGRFDKFDRFHKFHKEVSFSMSELVQIGIGGHREGFRATERRDSWWSGPAAFVCLFSGFVVYTTWAALQGDHYFHGSYLSPFYSPVLFTKIGVPGAAPADHAWLGTWPSWWPSFLPASPALLILFFPAAFRATCYYYRKAIYRSFAATPPACAVGGIGQSRYDGETGLLLFMNLHRYVLYPTLLYPVVLYYDAFVSFFRYGEFGVGVGCFVLLINATLITGYTCGCHCFRHLVGGRLDSYSSSGSGKTRFRLWEKVSQLNANHAQWALVSMVWVGLTDLYVRLVSMGYLADLNSWD